MSLIKLLKQKCTKKLFTTPSHAGKFFIFSKFRQFYKYDISETDCYNPQEALGKAQEKAGKIYGTKQTLFLTNGSTSGIIASVLACTNKDDKVLIWDNSHQCHKNAVELAGCTPIFYSVDINAKWEIPEAVSPQTIETKLKNNNIKAVIITSPTYEGVVSDIRKIKEICERYHTYLIVDEAHGALYPFFDELPESATKIADFTIQSLHKTAGGLNPTALLHNNTDIDAKVALSKINTTSPSYPLLASIEANINFLNNAKGHKIFKKLVSNINNAIQNSNCAIFAPDITKINLKHPNMSGLELSKLLYEKFNIEDEKTNNTSTLLLCGIGTDNLKLKKLSQALKSIK